MLIAGDADDIILRQRSTERLQMFLQPRLGIFALDVRGWIRQPRTQQATDQRTCLIEAAIEIHGGNHRLQRVGKDGVTRLPTAAQLTRPQAQDLAELDCIFDSNKRLGRCWEAQADGGPARVPVTPRMTVNSACAVRVAALEGLGITRSFEFLVRDDLAAGRLVEVLPEATRFDVPVQIVFAHRTLMPAKLRAFIDFSAERLGAALAADRPPLAGRPSSVSTVCP